MIGAAIMSFHPRQLLVCEKCFMEERENIKIALHLNMITSPIIGDIYECGLCYTKDNDREDKSSILHVYTGSSDKERAILDRFKEVCDIGDFNIHIYPNDKQDQT